MFARGKRNRQQQRGPAEGGAHDTRRGKDSGQVPNSDDNIAELEPDQSSAQDDEDRPVNRSPN